MVGNAGWKAGLGPELLENALQLGRTALGRLLAQEAEPLLVGGALAPPHHAEGHVVDVGLGRDRPRRAPVGRIVLRAQPARLLADRLELLVAAEGDARRDRLDEGEARVAERLEQDLGEVRDVAAETAG